MKKSIISQMAAIILLIIFVLAITMSASGHYLNQMTRNKAELLVDSLLKETENKLSIYQDSLRYNASYMCRYPILERLGEEESFETDEEAQSSSYFSQITRTNPEIRSAVIFDTKMRVVSTFGEKVVFPDRHYYLRTEEEMNADHYYEGSSNDSYAFFYPIYSGLSGQGKQIGMCVFIMERWMIDGTARNVLGDYTGAILLSDSNDLDFSMHLNGDIPKGTTMEDLRNDPDYIYREGNWQNGIRIAAAVSISKNDGDNRVVERLISVSFTLAIVLLAITLLFSYKQMLRPIRSITSFINRAIRHPDDRLQIEREDEIGVVAASLNQMLEENQKMIQEIREDKIRLYETRLARQKMEILAYRNQINPHFLYNTLSCMRDMAIIHDEESIAEMAMSLSDIFRYAVKGSNIVTVRDEVAYIEEYAKIIKYRFMGKITIKTMVPEEVLDLPIIRFFLQPLVENSVFHGLELLLEPGFVEVVITRGESTLEITVRDNGCGMDEETLEKLRRQVTEPGESGGIGLSNIVQRLKLFYGTNYRLTIDSTQNVGTVVSISVPDHIKGTQE